MPRNMEIDFVRQAIIQTIREEYIKDPIKYVGSENDILLTSFYEFVASDYSVDRYLEEVRELTDQQNRVGLIANGVIVAPSSPTITNLNRSTIIPMDYNITFRTTIEDVEKVKDTLDHMIGILKGRKVDIAELDSGELFMVGTMGNNVIGQPSIKKGDFIGVKPSNQDLNTWINSVISNLVDNYGFTTSLMYNLGDYIYYEDSGVLKVAVYDYDELSDSNKWSETNEVSDYQDIIFPKPHTSFEKWQLSISFDSFNLAQPKEMNSRNYIDLTFGGSATLCNSKVVLGNQITKVGIKLYATNTASGLDVYDGAVFHWVEPLELSSGNSAETLANQLISNNFMNNSHTSSLSLSRQYTFVMDYNLSLLQYWFEYARYGKQNNITPNLIYEIREILNRWGEVKVYDNYAKIIESIDVENTESDVTTLTIPFQLQGPNN